MRNNEEVSLGEALGSMFTSFQIADEVLEHRVKKAFGQLFGKLMENYITKITVSKDIVFVYVSSSTLRHELFLNRVQMTERINEELGEKLISKIILK